VSQSILKRMGIDIPADGTAVPPDFVIAQRASLVNILDIARKAGLKDSEFELYGNHKAKVCTKRCIWFIGYIVCCTIMLYRSFG
jgi:hypothetical protein